MQLQMAGQFNGGTLTSGVPLVVSMIGAPLPCTVTLKSAAAGRKIALSPDGGSEVFVPAVDTTTATMLVLAIKSSVASVVLTGAAGDTWDMR